MSHQEPQNQVKTEEASVEKRRRFIKGAGIATPVVLSLVNRSAFGAAQQCLSQQISGNMSQAAGAGSCESGQSPLTWKGPNPTGTNITNFTQGSDVTTGPTTVIDKEVEATVGTSTNVRIRIVVKTETTKKTYSWFGTGFIYGELTTTKTTTTITGVPLGGAVTTEVTVTNASPTPAVSPDTNDGTVIDQAKFIAGTKSEYTGANPLNSATDPATLLPAVCTDFTGGTTFNAVFGKGPTIPMREILCTNAASEDAYCVTALLNAAFVPAFNYVLNVSDVKALCNGTSQVPQGSASLSAFLASTWLNQP